MVALSFLLPFAAGCQSSKPTTAAATGEKPATTLQADNCAANLHELCGLLLQYYLIHRDLPPTLQDAAALADVLQPVSLTCPVSGKPYVYEAAGLIAAGESRRVIVVDSEPVHERGRWAIVTVPREGTTPLGLWVVKLSETAAQQYHRQ